MSSNLTAKIFPSLDDNEIIIPYTVCLLICMHALGFQFIRVKLMHSSFIKFDYNIFCRYCLFLSNSHCVHYMKIAEVYKDMKL